MYLADRSTPQGATDTPDRVRGTVRAVSPTVLALGTVSLVTDVSSEMVTAVLPLYLVMGLGLSPLGFGMLDGVQNGVSALVQLTGGHLADRVRNHKLVAGIGYGLSALCKPLLLVGSLGALGAALALDRVGKGLRTAPRDALISLSAPPDRQGRAFGVHRAMDTTGALLGPVLAFLILGVAAGGYDAVFAVSGCVAALGVLVLLLFVPGGRQAPAPPPASVPEAVSVPNPVSGVPEDRPVPEARADLRAAFGLLRTRRLRVLFGCAVLLGLTTVSDAFLYLLVQRRTGVDEQLFPLLPLGTATVFLLLALPLGRLADRIGRRAVFLAGHAGLLVAYGLLLWAPATPALPYLVLVLHGAFYAATDGVLPAAVAAVVPERLRASGIALVGTGQALARFCCSLAFGAAWAAWGDGPALAAAAAGLACCAAACGVALRPTPTTGVPR
ncbi:MFS transporter [Streptomyces roseicoloratus]|uniref:MFS transporter n=1 Tax=Streptomyces roseicoloratus TaxID=2508722 RepID=A0ABY9S1S8_9ACTN|nr:MFS transporter [Streptomyces roseicoloratus]WMX48197.1 MFS transporter [Streptomyces roseicoloratus]